MRDRKAGQETGWKPFVDVFGNEGIDHDHVLSRDDTNTCTVCHVPLFIVSDELAERRKRVGSYSAPEWFDPGRHADVVALADRRTTRGVSIPVAALDAIAARQKRRQQRRERTVLAGAAFAAGAAIAAAVTHHMGRHRG